tara:strand:+ start:1336 stop:1728 length:393 start_codon:yes stop_codon:yes gene_type:complete
MPSIAFGEDKSAAPMEPLADGKYNFEILEANFGQTQGGTEFMEVTLREVEGGRRVWQKLFFTAKAGWKLKSLLVAAGNDVQPGVTYDVNEEYAKNHLVGKTVGADVETDEYNGKSRNVVSRFEAATDKPF